MNMKKTLLLSVAALSLLAGCRSTGKDGALHNPEAAQHEVEARSVKMGNIMLEAIMKENYDTFTDAYDHRDTKITPEEFKSSCANFAKQFGKIKSFRYAFELDTPLVNNNIWVVTFERETGNGKDKKMLSQQLLFRLVTGEVDGMTRVIALGFL